MKKPFFSVGSINADCYSISGAGQIFLGGSASNTAQFLGMLLDQTGFDVFLVGLLGDDELGSTLRSLIGQKKFSPKYIKTQPGKTGATKISLDEHHERTIMREESVSNYLPEYLADPALMVQLANSMIHLKANKRVLECLFNIESHIFSCDISGILGNSSYSAEERQNFIQWSSRAFQGHAIRILFGNDEEFALLLSLMGICQDPQGFIKHNNEGQIELVRQLLLQWHSELAAIKLGKAGAILVSSNQYYQAPVLTIKPVDTTGAGDAFNAGFIYSLLSNEPLEVCLQLGCILGSLNCLHYGGQELQITPQELRNKNNF